MPSPCRMTTQLPRTGPRIWLRWMVKPWIRLAEVGDGTVVFEGDGRMKLVSVPGWQLVYR